MITKRFKTAAITLPVAGLLAVSVNMGVAADTPYYQGKTITILEGRSPGGTGGIKTQTAIKFVLKYLPGNPSVVYQFMPGAGGISAVNHLIHKAPRDGLTIGGVSSAIVSSVITALRVFASDWKTSDGWVRDPREPPRVSWFVRDWASTR